MSDYLDLRDGPTASVTASIFFALANAPTLLFIQGGAAPAKATFAVFDEGVMTRDIKVALVGYTMAPDAGRIKSSS